MVILSFEVNLVDEKLSPSQKSSVPTNGSEVPVELISIFDQGYNDVDVDDVDNVNDADAEGYDVVDRFSFICSWWLTSNKC